MPPAGQYHEAAQAGGRHKMSPNVSDVEQVRQLVGIANGSEQTKCQQDESRRAGLVIQPKERDDGRHQNRRHDQSPAQHCLKVLIPTASRPASISEMYVPHLESRIMT